MKKLAAIILIFACTAMLGLAQPHKDSDLAKVEILDAAEGRSGAEAPSVTVADHMYRADVYMSNRRFPPARSHWQKVLANHPNDSAVPKALFGMGRSNMWERRYETAANWFRRLAERHTEDFYGREGLAFLGACYVRLGKNLDAARTYEKYASSFPEGERIESSYLNIIDAYREAERFSDASKWAARAIDRFKGTETEVNALHALLRMHLFRGHWSEVRATSDKLLSLNRFSGTMAYKYEVRYLKAYSLERLGRKNDAIRNYQAIPAQPTSYFGGLATEKIRSLGGPAAAREAQMNKKSAALKRSFPVVYRASLLRYSRSKGLDPRFLLAMMKQESSFRTRAKSPAAARGLLQLTYDTAIKYNTRAGIPRITATSLYSPRVNIAIGSTYIADLKKEFSGMYEAIACSYNGGEDNAARWLARSRPRVPAVFVSEIGFSETKKYVLRVMGNYRIYRTLYDKRLRRR